MQALKLLNSIFRGIQDVERVLLDSFTFFCCCCGSLLLLKSNKQIRELTKKKKKQEISTKASASVCLILATGLASKANLNSDFFFFISLCETLFSIFLLFCLFVCLFFFCSGTNIEPQQVATSAPLVENMERQMT